jgi:DsbC/DsbD-like thiol-disulfide interchange protein
MPALFLFLLAAQQGAAIDSKYLTLTPSAGSPVGQGGRVTLALAVAPKPRIHVYAPGQPGYIPISLKLEAAPAYRPAGEPQYPKPETLFFKPLNERFKVYSQPFRITQDIIVSPGPRASGPHESVVVNGKVTYQACDDLVCYLPVDVPVTWTLKVTAPK